MNRFAFLLLPLLSACAVTVTPLVPAAVVTVQGQRVATEEKLCKKEGWREVVRRDGSRFRNQGDCVSYVRTGR